MLPIIGDEKLKGKIILCINIYGRTPWCMERNCTTVQMQNLRSYRVYFVITYSTKKWVKDCSICAIAHQQVPIQPRGTRIALLNHGNRSYAYFSMNSSNIGRLKLYSSPKYIKNYSLTKILGLYMPFILTRGK